MITFEFGKLIAKDATRLPFVDFQYIKPVIDLRFEPSKKYSLINRPMSLDDFNTTVFSRLTTKIRQYIIPEKREDKCLCSLD